MLKSTYQIFAVLVAFACNSSCLFAQFTADDVFAATPSDYRYLWYGMVENEFDSALVNCVFGEVRIAEAADTTRINMRLSKSQFANEFCPLFVHGSNGQGRDTHLDEYIRTEPFTLPTGASTISYVRMVSAETNTDCFELDDSNEKDDYPADWREAQYAVTNAAHILDTTIFTIELVNVTDSTVQTIDSLLIPPGQNNHTVLTGEGGSIKRVCHEWNVPTVHQGDSAYLRMCVYRYGPTPYGVNASMYRSFHSISTVFRDTLVPYANLPRWNDAAFGDSLYDEYVSQIVEYMFSDTSRTCLPRIFGLHGLPARSDSILMSRLADSSVTVGQHCDCKQEWRSDSAQIYSTLYPPVSYSKPGVVVVPRQRNTDGAQQPRTSLALPLSEVFNGSEVVVNGASPDVTIVLYDLLGRQITQIWKGAAPRVVEVRDIPQGSPRYGILLLEDHVHGHVHAVKVLVKH